MIFILNFEYVTKFPGQRLATLSSGHAFVVFLCPYEDSFLCRKIDRMDIRVVYNFSDTFTAFRRIEYSANVEVTLIYRQSADRERLQFMMNIKKMDLFLFGM